MHRFVFTPSYLWPSEVYHTKSKHFALMLLCSSVGKTLNPHSSPATTLWHRWVIIVITGIKSATVPQRNWKVVVEVVLQSVTDLKLHSESSWYCLSSHLFPLQVPLIHYSSFSKYSSHILSTTRPPFPPDTLWIPGYSLLLSSSHLSRCAAGCSGCLLPRLSHGDTLLHQGDPNTVKRKKKARPSPTKPLWPWSEVRRPGSPGNEQYEVGRAAGIQTVHYHP